MTDDDVKDVLDQANETKEQWRRAKAERKQRSLMLKAIISGSLAVIASVAVVFYIAITANSRDTASATLIGDLSDQLDAASARTAKYRDGIDEEDQCSKRYDDVVSSAQALYLSAIGDDVVILSTEQDTDARRTRLAEQAKTIARTNTAHVVAINERIQWNLDGNPLPCPVPAQQVQPLPIPVPVQSS